MQSVLQYGRFGKRLREQVRRHGIDATAGVRGSTHPHTKSSSHPATELKDLEAGHPPLGEGRDHALEEKDVSDHEAEEPQPAYIGPGDNAAGEDNLSGSTTRSSSTSTADRSRLGLSTTTTQATIGTRLGQALTGINVRSRTTKEGRHERGGKVFVVGYVDEKDPLNPHNWSSLKRMSITFLVASIGLIVGFASSVDSAALQQARLEFGVSEVTESLATGIYLIGFGCG
jgi:hypothetical protein